MNGKKDEENDDKKDGERKVETLTNSYLMVDPNKLNGVIPRLYNYTDYNAFSRPTEDIDMSTGGIAPSGTALPDPIVGKRIQLPDGDTTVTALGWAATGEQNSGWIRAAADDYQYLVNGSSVTEWVAGGFRVNNLTSGSVVFAGTSGLLSQNNASFFWDNANLRLTVGNAKLYTPGTSNLFIGNAAGNLTLTGTENTAIGEGCLAALTIGATNVGVGHAVLASDTTGASNTAIGYRAMAANVGGGFNVAVGYRALQTNNDGIDNVAVGYQALRDNVTGDYNTAIGVNTLAKCTASFNTGCGLYVLSEATIPEYNSGYGYQALFNTTLGDLNTAVGANAMYTNTEGIRNVAVGVSALFANNLGDFNVAVGTSCLAGANTTTANANTAVGYEALTSTTTGANNTALGYQAGRNALTVDGGVYIGFQAGLNETTGNRLYISNSNSATPLIFGDFSTGIVKFHASNATTATPIHELFQASTGDVGTRWTLTGGNSFVAGIDNSASDSWKLSYGATGNAAFGVNDWITVDTAGIVTVDNRIRNGDGSSALPSYSFGAGTSLGFLRGSGTTIWFAGGGSGRMSLGTTGLRLVAAGLFSWSSDTNPDGTGDTFLNRNAASVLGLSPDGLTIHTKLSCVTAVETVFNETQADIDHRFEGDSISHLLFLDATATTENIAVFAAAAPNWQAMDRGFFVGDTTAAPTGNPASGGFLYSEAGALKWRGSSGTVTTLGPS